MLDSAMTGSHGSSKAVERLLCSLCGNDYVQHIPATNFQQFPHLSRTNNPPAAAEVTAVEADVAVRQTEIEALQRDIDKLRGALDALESRKSEAEAALTLLREIFRTCVDDWQRSQDYVRRRSLPELPWDLTFVCGKWREIASSFPYIWSLIRQPEMLHEQALQLMLDRSVPLPLEIRIRSWIPSDILADSHPVAKLLLPSSSRWKTLEVDVLRLEALMPIRGHLDQLEELHVNFFHLRRYHEIPLTMFQLGPALRRVKIVHKHGSQDTARIQLPWSTITHVSAYAEGERSEEHDVFLQLEPLSLCTNLIEANIRRISLLAAEMVPPDTILPNLTLLSVTTVQKDAMSILLNKLTLPALTVLELDNVDEWNDADQQSLGSLVSRSQCSLTSVKFQNLSNVHPSFITFLSNSPTITSMYLGYESMALLPYLLGGGPSSERQVLLPKLTQFKLRLMDSDEEDLDIGALLDMVETRLPPHCEEVAEVGVPDFGESRLGASEQARVKLLRKRGVSFVMADKTNAQYEHQTWSW
ncbi:hypothetical protein C8J56DRAFT_921459 [Mycena floridula]|nr:hypothetical protein C8J56DRAFT_921459 [Mycena floridula]